MVQENTDAKTEEAGEASMQTTTTTENKPMKAKKAKTVKAEKSIKPKKPAKLKITRFDKAVAEEISRGVFNKKLIQEKLRVDPIEFEKRLETLLKQGYIVKDAVNEDVIRFGIKGFNAFFELVRKKESGSPTATRSAITTSSVSEIQQPVSNDPLQKTLELNQPATAEGKVDLSELLAKGAPKTTEGLGNKQDSRREEKSRQEIPAPATGFELAQILRQDSGVKHEGNALKVGGESACELCKKKFKLTVGKSVGGKYGHCFCGAAYHKDCYETLLDNSDNGGKCIRCGRKLELKLDKRSEEAVKELKELF